MAAVQERASLAALAHIFPPELYPYPREAVHARWAVAVEEPEKRTLIAVSEEEPVGAACVAHGWLEGLYVVPERWGTGLADELHDRALEEVRGLGSSSCRLWVLEDNIRARRFYERRGWRENGETRVVGFPPNPLDIGYGLLHWLHEKSALRTEPHGVAPRRQRPERGREP
ncbi:MAG TPA: GNAT family N-acetyltransferase [Gaiellaceae bacterium]|nr:GNAT family N-acetyltransferase [Gaiellaceae bacterium]